MAAGPAYEVSDAGEVGASVLQVFAPLRGVPDEDHGEQSCARPAGRQPKCAVGQPLLQVLYVVWGEPDFGVEVFLDGSVLRAQKAVQKYHTCVHARSITGS